MLRIEHSTLFVELTGQWSAAAAGNSASDQLSAGDVNQATAATAARDVMTTFGVRDSQISEPESCPRCADDCH
jgi:hypothetical protein